MGIMKEIPFFDQMKEAEVSEKKHYELDFYLITISGRSGTGKTTLGKFLSERYEIPFIKVGDEFFRKKTESETGNVPLGFMERGLNHDKWVDEKQKELIKEAILNNKPIILEGRLAGFLANEVLRSMKATPTQRDRVVRVQTTAHNDTRFERIRKRTISDVSRRTGISREVLEQDPRYNIGTIARETKKREKGDRERWKRVHRRIEDIDIFKPSITDNKGRSIYSFSQSTNHYSVEEVEHIIHSVLLTKGLVREIDKNEAKKQEEIVFKSP